MPGKKFWAGKRVYLTGHTGFKGSWTAIWLKHLGADVAGYALKPDGTLNLFEVANLNNHVRSKIGDICDYPKLSADMQTYNPDILIHMAAQSLVGLSYAQPQLTYQTNVIGTVNVLEAARHCDNLGAIISVTTDKCYDNKEWVWPYRESDPIGGHDPYSSSKGCAELVTAAYRESFLCAAGKGLASVRAGNVIGGGDWAADRLVPDIVRAIYNDTTLSIRKPNAIRPWQHVLDPVAGYLQLAELLFNEPEGYSEAWNFGPADNDAKPVSWIVSRLVELMGGKAWNLDTKDRYAEARLLKLDISKAKSRLGWSPRWSLDDALTAVCDWHNAWASGENMFDKCVAQIVEFDRSSRSK